MILSTEPAFIFVAVPKTGSSSVEQALANYDNSSLSGAFNKHVLAMKLADELPESLWKDSFKLAFVREPFDWLYSWYRFRQRQALSDPSHPRHALYTGGISFDVFAQSFSDVELMLKQSDFICTHSGELLVDEVGRFESLGPDFERFCARLGLQPAALPRVNVSASSTLERPALSSAAKACVEDYFRQDFELFGY